MSGAVYVPKRLWTVTQVGAVTNERAAGISRNPLPVPSGFTGAAFTFLVTAKNNLTLGNITVYGAIGDELTAPSAFPGPGLTALSLAYTNSNLAAGTGLTHAAKMEPGEAGDALNIYLLAPVLPNWLLLEYTTSAPGAGPTITFEVWLLAVGPKIIDRS